MAKSRSRSRSRSRSVSQSRGKATKSDTMAYKRMMTQVRRDSARPPPLRMEGPEVKVDLPIAASAIDAMDLTYGLNKMQIENTHFKAAEIGMKGESQLKYLVDKIVGGVMQLAEKWLAWRRDDNVITYFVRVLMGVVIALYIFYYLNFKYLNKYLFRIKHSLTYLMELDK